MDMIPFRRAHRKPFGHSPVWNTGCNRRTHCELCFGTRQLRSSGTLAVPHRDGPNLALVSAFAHVPCGSLHPFVDSGGPAYMVPLFTDQLVVVT